MLDILKPLKRLFSKKGELKENLVGIVIMVIILYIIVKGLGNIVIPQDFPLLKPKKYNLNPWSHCWDYSYSNTQYKPSVLAELF